MSVVDYLLNSLIKRLKKTQKERKKKKAKKRSVPKKSSKPKKLQSPKKRAASEKKKQVKKKKRVSGRPAKRILQKPSKAKKTKKALRKVPPRVKAKPKKIKKVKKVKKVVKKTSKVSSASGEVCIGEVTHFFSRIQVIVLKMKSGALRVGDQIHILGGTTDFVQKVKSLQIESVDVKLAKKGQLVGLKVGKKTKPGDQVFKC